PAPQPVTDSDDSEELFLPRRRKHSVLPLVALLGLLLLVGLSVVAVRFLFAMRSARQREAVAVAEARQQAMEAQTAKEPERMVIALGDRERWTHKELAGFLRAKGITIDVSNAPDPTGWPSSAFKEPAGGDPTDWPTVEVLLCPDRRAAIEAAGAYGESGFAWGRFAFHASIPARGDRQLLARMRNALP
ncbi:MAG TPA: hypothetical protein VKE74_28320, partial [Gemmataceae bacterium]|nr:hypothetical protein [Gemmataceae bacterium]